MRHLLAVQEGEDFAPDSMIPHLVHIMCGCGVVIDAKACDVLIDDRVRGNPDALERTQIAIRESRRLQNC